MFNFFQNLRLIDAARGVKVEEVVCDEVPEVVCDVEAEVVFDEVPNVEADVCGVTDKKGSGSLQKKLLANVEMPHAVVSPANPNKGGEGSGSLKKLPANVEMPHAVVSPANPNKGGEGSGSLKKLPANVEMPHCYRPKLKTKTYKTKYCSQSKPTVVTSDVSYASVTKRNLPYQYKDKDNTAMQCNMSTTVTSHNVGHHHEIDIDHAVLGHFHQGDLNLFDVDSLGKQCTCNALLALCQLPLLTTYPPEALDSILLEGDQLYKNIQMKLSPADRNQYMTFGQLPSRIPIQNPKYTVSKHESFHTHGRHLERSQGLMISLHEALLRSFYQANTVLVMIGANAVAMFKKQDKYFVFDSHSRDENGLVTPDGHSVLLEFQNIEKLEIYLKKIASQLCSVNSPIVECLPVTIHKLNSEETKLLTGYFNQQEAISQEKLSNILPGTQNMSPDKLCSNITQTDYNRIYKQKQRSNKVYHQKELLQKQQIRSNKEYKQKEMLQKQQVRNDIEYREKEKQKELVQKQQVRSSSKEYREKEMLQKQQVRNSSKEYREKEMLQKQKVRSSEEYREKEKQKELVQKQQVRSSSKEYREKEMLQKQQVRSSSKEYREKEMLQKQKVRSSKEYREKEMLQKQQVRSSEEYREKEMLQKQQVRSSERI